MIVKTFQYLKIMTVKFQSFKNARDYVHGLQLKNEREWISFCKSNKKPNDIPSVPRHQYTKEWKGLGDWLGTYTIAPQNKKFRSFKEAKKFVRSLNLKSYYDWLDYCKSNKKPNDIPSVPRQHYTKEWKGFSDWLGTYTIAPQNKKFRSFKKARLFARSLKLNAYLAWAQYYKTNTLPIDIPTTPNRTYKNQGWIGWADWLGTNNKASYQKKFLKFKKARSYTRKLNLTTNVDWFNYVRTTKPDFLPIHPSRKYKSEWISWNDWLKG